jgi:endonuclease/exonuclease/phosphatase (EEP) superfamily protein YafD
MSFQVEYFRKASRAIPVAVWLLTLALAAIAVLRVVCHDGNTALTCLNAFSRYIYLPAYVFLFYAIRKRMTWLAIVNALVISCHISWLAPDFMRDRRFESGASSTSVAKSDSPESHVRILFANVWYLNPHFDDFLQEVEKANPDVVILVEFPWAWREPFRDSPVMAKYRYGHGYKPWRFEQVVVYSQLPLKTESERTITDRVVQFLDIAVGKETLRLIGLHSPRPTYFRDDDYAGFWHELSPLILQSSHPLVVIGDFNATQNSRVYKELKRSGLRSAHEDRGRGYAVTWPNGTLPIPPIRIDQAFLSQDVACHGIVEGLGAGSDHKPLILDVEIAGKQ